MKRLRTAILIVIALSSHQIFAEAGWQSLGDFAGIEQSGNQVELSAQRGKLRITAVAPDVIRVTYGPGGTLPEDRSFAVIANAFPATAAFRVSENASTLELRTTLLTVIVDKSPLRLSFLD